MLKVASKVSMATIEGYCTTRPALCNCSHVLFNCHRFIHGWPTVGIWTTTEVAMHLQ